MSDPAPQVGRCAQECRRLLEQKNPVYLEPNEATGVERKLE